MRAALAGAAGTSGDISRQLASLGTLFESAAEQLAAEVGAAAGSGLLDGGLLSRAVVLVGEQALWLALCFQVRLGTGN